MLCMIIKLSEHGLPPVTLGFNPLNITSAFLFLPHLFPAVAKEGLILSNPALLGSTTVCNAERVKLVPGVVDMPGRITMPKLCPQFCGEACIVELVSNFL